MGNKEVIVYVSDNNLPCKKLLNQMDQWNISYKIKNVTKNKENMKELQEQGIYGTPATFIENQEHAILGFQENKISYALGIRDEYIHNQSHHE